MTEMFRDSKADVIPGASVPTTQEEIEKFWRDQPALRSNAGLGLASDDDLAENAGDPTTSNEDPLNAEQQKDGN